MNEKLRIIRQKNRKHLAILIYANAIVVMKVPHNCEQFEIDDFMNEQQEWIHTSIEKLKSTNDYIPPPPEKKYESGENFNVLGKQYRLKVHTACKNLVEIDDKYIHLYTHHTSAEKKQLVMDDWYKMEAMHIFTSVIDEYYKGKICDSPHIVFGDLECAWVSHQKKKNWIVINPRLIELPRYYIEYVIVCEMVCMKHSKKLAQYNELCRIMPDWDFRKNKRR